MYCCCQQTLLYAWLYALLLLLYALLLFALQLVLQHLAIMMFAMLCTVVEVNISNDCVCLANIAIYFLCPARTVKRLTQYFLRACAVMQVCTPFSPQDFENTNQAFNQGCSLYGIEFKAFFTKSRFQYKPITSKSLTTMMKNHK